ncbi:MAG: class I SAM-dependent methyltransferase [Actinomycetota bacterium]
MPPTLPAWYFPEFSPIGVDLDSVDQVQQYDRNQGTDEAKDDALLDRLPVGEGTVFVDLGTGTGSLPVRAAQRGSVAHAVDVSANMLAAAARRAAAAEAEVAQQHAGFLSHTFQPGSVDVVTSRSALHQLPDTWKQVALNRVAAMLRPGGTFYLWDAMWSFPADELDRQLPAWIDAMARPAGEGFTREMFETHVREEFSTFTWIIEGMIERAGLQVIESDFPAPWYGEFLAVRRRAGS